MRISAIALLAAVVIIGYQSLAAASEDKKNYPGSACEGKLGIIGANGDFVNGSTSAEIKSVICPIIRDSTASSGSQVEYAEILVTNIQTVCKFSARHSGIDNFFSGVVATNPNSIVPIGGSVFLLRFAVGDGNIVASGGTFDSYFFRCNLPGGATIRYYSVTENDGEG